MDATHIRSGLTLRHHEPTPVGTARDIYTLLYRAYRGYGGIPAHCRRTEPADVMCRALGRRAPKVNRRFAPTGSPIERRRSMVAFERTLRLEGRGIRLP